MVSAMVFVNTDLESTDTVLENVKKIEGVEEAHLLWGIYDLAVKITAKSVEKLKEIIKFRLRQLPGVTSSLTLMIFEEPATTVFFEEPLKQIS
jgi:DNA-binding Lrp family transcriptional regulator